ncbi:MAG: peptidyl-prolyl cis-trans isomerase [Spirochaetaceae bacterium]|jgi:parvulin-like peptidyl-prolyl isomerase|nr:peptidyl-prolyl cis-trans isomerase [Spirochaetaceae bacterium]
MDMKRFFILMLFGVVLAGFLPAQMDLQPAAIVRLTKSEPITVKQFRTEVERMEKQERRTLNTAERRQVLDLMINERLAIQAAERDRVTVSDNEVNQQLQQLRGVLAQNQGRQPTDAEFAAAVRSEYGLELPAFREQIRRQYLVQKYLMSKKQDLIQSVKTPTEAEIQNFYNLNRAEFVRPDTVRFSMIQVPFGPTAADKTKARELVDRLVREIGSNPTKFDEAVIKSQSPGSGYQGGDAGYVPRNAQAQQVVGQELLDTVFTLKQGEVSRMVESPRGYHIIKVTETYEMKTLALDDVIQPGNRTTVHDYIGSRMLQERQQGVIVQATQELVTELRAGNSFEIFERNLNW